MIASIPDNMPQSGILGAIGPNACLYLRYVAFSVGCVSGIPGGACSWNIGHGRLLFSKDGLDMWFDGIDLSKVWPSQLSV